MKGAIGIDLGGTRIKAGWVPATGPVSDLKITPTHRERGVEEVMKQLERLATDLMREHGSAAIGLALPGLVDVDAGVVVTSPNFPAWRQVPVGRLLGERLGVSVTTLNDASAATWGEVQRGAVVGERNVAGFTLGTGVGGGLVLDGRLRLGPSSMAAEFGHIVVQAQGSPCGCGGRGCLEQSLGTDALRQILAASQGPWSGRAHEPDVFVSLAQGARDGEASALALFEGAGRALGYGIASVALVADVDHVVLMGGMAGASDLLIPAAHRGLQERLYGELAGRITIHPTSLGDQAGVLGAALWAMNQ